MLLLTVTLTACGLSQIAPFCLIADGFHLSGRLRFFFCFFAGGGVVCFFTMTDSEAVTHGAEARWSDQQHTALSSEIGLSWLL